MKLNNIISNVCLIVILVFGISSQANSQTFEERETNFVIKKMKPQIFNDTIYIRLLYDFIIEDEQGTLSGRGVLSMCNCYCDSIWDAWPSEVGGGIPGTGTMYFVSDGNPDSPPPTSPQSSVLGILGVEGGIPRTTEFNLSSFILWDD